METAEFKDSWQQFPELPPAPARYREWKSAATVGEPKDQPALKTSVAPTAVCNNPGLLATAARTA
jgi:hypothetical protein